MGKLSCRKKKLSWSYRRKAKLRKSKEDANTNNNKDVNLEDSKIIIRNLPSKATEEDVRKLYESFGEIKEINLLKNQDGTLVGGGFIQFKCMADASKAIFKTNKKEFLGKTISSSWAISESKYYQKLEEKLGIRKTDEGEEGEEGDENNKDEKHSSQDIHKEEHKDNNSHQKEKDDLRKQKRRKLKKMNRQKKRARLIIRNLSFKATDDILKEFFSQYGNIQEIKILTRPDGKRTGCAFVQFDRVQSAAKAMHYGNMQPLLNRLIVIDWAVSKSKFSKNSIKNNDVKQEIMIDSSDEDEAVNSSLKISHISKNEANNSNDELDRKEIATCDIKIEDESDVEEKAVCKTEINEDENESVNDSCDDDNDSEIRESIKKESGSDEEISDAKCPRWKSNDVREGKTVFLKNVPFNVKNEELKKYMEQFGPVYYALVCIDPLTEYSKGTAFVKFKDIVSAEKCLASGTELRMYNQIIEAYKALQRNEVEHKGKLKTMKIKDSRNLYLIKEGVVLAGSPAASEVSVFDMAKRLKLEQWKSQMLRNLNMFISRVRLVIHNLPPNLDDTKLRQLFKNHSGPKAIIKEARVMRDLKNVDATGRGKSKEYGFVTFTNHEDALKVLRSINNNPNIFSKNKRPIVGFSIEDRTIVNAKEKRLQKSRERNPLWSGNEFKRKIENTKEDVSIKRVKTKKSDDSSENYAGTTGKLGQNKLRSNFHLKSQAKLHMRLVKKENKLSRAIKQKKENMKKKQKAMPMKRKETLDTDEVNFNKLVNNYRNKLEGTELKKSKWYGNT